MKLAKRLGYKLIIVLCIIATFCSFIASTPVHASKVSTTDFYYSGTSKGSYTVNKGLLETIVEALGMILDYLLGLMTMGFRMVFVGWTALFERCLTLIIQGLSGEEVEVDGVSPTSLFSADGWITLDAIFFNQVSILDINFFRFEKIEGYDSLGYKIEDETAGETEEHDAPMVIYTEEIENENGEKGTVEISVVQGEKNNFHPGAPEPPEEDDDESLIILFKKSVAGWYYTLRLIAIMVMLVILVYIGIQLAIKSVATDKAVYKKMLLDWLVGMILIFTLHYIMIAIISFNEILVEQISKLRTGPTSLAVYEYGLKERAAEPITNDELELTLYDEVKTRAYDLKMTVGTTGMIMYMVLVYYAWKFTFIYLKRYLTVAVLIIMAPIVSASYAYNRVRTGKAEIFSKWLKEFTFTVMLQSIHALIYVVFVQTALGMSLGSIASFIFVLILFNFMGKADGLFRKIFGIGGQGGILSDVADGPGLKDTLKDVTNIAAAKEIAGAAKAVTKTTAKALTKPVRMAGEAGFSYAMKKRAESKDKEAMSQNIDGVHNYSDWKKYQRNQRTQAMEFGGIMEQLDNKEIDVDLMQKYVDSLQIGEAITDINGNPAGIVDQAYIDEQRKKVNKVRDVMGMTKDEREYWQEQYAAMHTKKGKFKALSIYLSDKWQDIIDPTTYVNRVAEKDKEGNVTYHYEAIEKQVEYTRDKKYQFKRRKVLDSVGRRLANKLTLQNLANLSKEEKKALEQQAELAKSEIFGFVGILTGMPLLVANPSAGMAMMTAGIANASKSLTGDGKRTMRSIGRFKVDAQGNYIFNRFEGRSKKTIAEGAKAMAQYQVTELAYDRMEQEASVKKRFIQRHPKMAAMFKDKAISNLARTGAVGAGEVAGLTALQAFKVAGITVLGAPPVAMAAGAVAGAAFTGNILKESTITDNAWARYQETIRAARKAEKKADEKRKERAGLDDYMNVLAEKYFDLEHDEFKDDAQRHAGAFEEEYVAAVHALDKAIEAKTQEELLRDSGFDDVQEGIKKGKDGKITISVDAENKMIENALVTYAIQAGATDISQISITAKKGQIEKILKTDMITRGISEDSETMKVVMEGLENKLKDAQENIRKDNRGETAIRDKMAGDAIVSAMQEKGVTDVSQVTDDEIMQKFTAAYQRKAEETMQSSAQSNTVLSELVSQKTDAENEEAPKAFDIEKFKAQARESIQARKTSFADRAKQGLDEGVTAELRKALKKKKQLEFDSQILEEEEKLEGMTSLAEMAENLKGGLDKTDDGSVVVEASSTDDIIKMLELQTQLHQDKRKLQMVGVKRGDEAKERIELYKELHAPVGETGGRVSSSEGVRRVSKKADGSKQVGADIPELTEILKKHRI